MEKLKDIAWFKKEIASTLTMFEITYREYENGDFGPLSQVVLESPKIGGNIDFWGLGWLGIYVFDYLKDQELLNVLLEPSQRKEQRIAFDQLLSLLDKVSN